MRPDVCAAGGLQELLFTIISLAFYPRPVCLCVYEPGISCVHKASTETRYLKPHLDEQHGVLKKKSVHQIDTVNVPILHNGLPSPSGLVRESPQAVLGEKWKVRPHALPCQIIFSEGSDRKIKRKS